jgi:hypothetical protein
MGAKQTEIHMMLTLYNKVNPNIDELAMSYIEREVVIQIHIKGGLIYENGHGSPSSPIYSSCKLPAKLYCQGYLQKIGAPVRTTKWGPIFQTRFELNSKFCEDCPHNFYETSSK